MKHLTCDLCGKPAEGGDSVPPFMLVIWRSGKLCLILCTRCEDQLLGAIYAQCAELKKSHE